MYWEQIIELKQRKTLLVHEKKEWKQSEFSEELKRKDKLYNLFFFIKDLLLLLKNNYSSL